MWDNWAPSSVTLLCEATGSWSSDISVRGHWVLKYWNTAMWENWAPSSVMLLCEATGSWNSDISVWRHWVLKYWNTAMWENWAPSSVMLLCEITGSQSVTNGWALTGPCTAVISGLLCVPLCSASQQSYVLKEVLCLTYRGVLIATWFQRVASRRIMQDVWGWFNFFQETFTSRARIQILPVDWQFHCRQYIWTWQPYQSNCHIQAVLQGTDGSLRAIFS
jgi:hypothetical protein